MKAANRKALDQWVAWQTAQGRTAAFLETYTRFMTKAVEAGEAQDKNYTIHPPTEAECSRSKTPPAPVRARLPPIPKATTPSAAAFWAKR